MCGIAAIVSKESFIANSLKKMANVISHRGPDDQGYYFTNGNENSVHLGGDDTPSNVYHSNHSYTPKNNIDKDLDSRFKLGLAHRRLSILDLSPSGHQPMSINNDRFWIIYNGEVYNYLEVKSDLINKSHEFKSNSDTEVILAAYAEWGPDCFNKFVGMWSLIIYDSLKNELFASRDRYGIKPLYYWLSPKNNLHFASEIKQFTVLDEWKSTMNSQRVSDYLAYAFTDHTDETMFQGVYQVPGGHSIRLNLSNLEFQSPQLTYNRWYQSNPQNFKGSFTDACFEFNSKFKQSIDLHLRSDVPIGSALSGGLDSSAIVCEINSILKAKGAQHLQKTFSSCSTHEKFNEREWMDVVINHTKIDASFVYPNMDRLFELTEDLIWIHDEPYQSQSVYLGYHVFELAKQNGVKVLLNGQGADEYLGGYGQFTTTTFSQLLKALKLKTLIEEIRNAKSNWNYNSKNIIPKLLYNLQPYRSKEYFTHKKRNPFSSYINYKELGVDPKHPNSIIPIKLRSIKNISDYHLFHNPLNKYLKWEDRNSMSNSIEARVPFLDHRLVEFCQSLNVEYLEKGGERKRILRQGLKELLPKKIKERKDKKGFVTPEEKWVKSHPKLFRKKLIDSIDKSFGIINPKILDHFDRIISGDIPFDYSYWRFTVFSEWLNKFNFEH